MTEFKFRLLLIASVISALVGAALDIWLITLPEVSSIGDYSLLGLIVIIAISAIIIGIWIALCVGLYRFSWWAPRASLVALAATVVFYPLAGQIVTTGYAEAFFMTSELLSGAVLACAYWSPISTRFKKIKI